MSQASVEHGTFVIERDFPQPPARVFAAWATPEAKAAWFAGPAGGWQELEHGMLLAAAGLGLFALAPAGGSFMVHVLPGMLLLGLGCGVALNPVMLAAMSDVDPSESGLASGVINTSFMVGGSIGLAALASLSAARGYHAAFAVGALFAAVAAALSFFLNSTPSENSDRKELACDS